MGLQHLKVMHLLASLKEVADFLTRRAFALLSEQLIPVVAEVVADCQAADLGHGKGLGGMRKAVYGLKEHI